LNAYEITFIVRPDLDDDSIDAVVEQVAARIQSGGGEIIATLPWTPARRRMAYPIKDYGDGVYITITFRFDSQSLREMESGLRLNERILRFLVVQSTDLQVQQAQQRLLQRQAAAAAPPPTPVQPAGFAPALADPETVTDVNGASAVETEPVDAVDAPIAETESASAPVTDTGWVQEELAGNSVSPEPVSPAPEPEPITETEPVEVTER